MPNSEPLSGRTQAPIYAMAFFTGNLFPIVTVVMPLWALELDSSPAVIGLIIASRQFLTVFLAIHGGALMDRFDPKMVTLVLCLTGMATTGLFPVLPFVWAAILLQMVSGFAETTNWIGTQALVGRVLRGQAVYAGRMTAAARIGGFIGPILAGLAWQTFGPSGAFAFIAAWIFCGMVMALLLPEIPAVEPVKDPEPVRRRPRIASLLPKLADYKATFGLLLFPAVALVIASTFMRQTGSGVQSSFYGVWLSQAGYSAGLIGALIGFSNLISAGAALSVGPLTRRLNEHWLLLATVLLAIAGIAVTPMIDAVVLLFVAISLRGIGQGLNLPLMISISSRAVGLQFQGRVAALRISFNRLGSMLVPVIMGLIAEFYGLETAFYVVGLAGFALIGGLAVWTARRPEF